MTIASAALLLFLVMDPLGNIPFFLAALKNVHPSRQRWVVGRELLIALAVLVVFLFAGRYLLDLLQISEPALAIAGGVILFLIAVRMIFPSSDKSLKEDIEGEPFIVPLAIPYVAGPSALVTELLLMVRSPRDGRNDCSLCSWRGLRRASLSSDRAACGAFWATRG